MTLATLSADRRLGSHALPDISTIFYTPENMSGLVVFLYINKLIDSAVFCFYPLNGDASSRQKHYWQCANILHQYSHLFWYFVTCNVMIA